MLTAFIVLTAHALGALSVAHAVMGTRTPQGTVAWTVSLLTFPYVAVPAYWVFGRRRFEGYVVARQSRRAEFREGLGRVLDGLREYRLPEAERVPAIHAAEELALLPTLRGNEVELLVDGEATFRSILEGIRAAKHYVLFQFYIVRDDGLGREVADALMDRVRQGVAVYFLYDRVGSLGLPNRYTRALREAGVAVYEFRTGRSVPRLQVNFRNHRKIVVVDGSTAWTGGHNVGDEYLGKGKRGPWRDTHVRVTGPAAIAAQVSFAEDWHWASESIPELNWTPQPSSNSDVPVLVMPSGPADEVETAGLMFVHALNSARERIWIATPYFIPDEAVLAALQLAALRGVDVRILIPERPDSLLVHLATFAYLVEPCQVGVRFFRYRSGFMHQKVAVIDRSAATVGSANFDNRSFRLNFEATAAVAAPEFADQVERMFEADFARAREVGREDYEGRPWWFRVATRLASLASPVL